MYQFSVLCPGARLSPACAGQKGMDIEPRIEMIDRNRAREEMVERRLARRGIKDAKALAACARCREGDGRRDPIAGGVTAVPEVRAALVVRQREWETSGHPDIRGRSPVEAILAERETTPRLQ